MNAIKNIMLAALALLAWSCAGKDAAWLEAETAQGLTVAVREVDPWVLKVTNTLPGQQAPMPSRATVLAPDSAARAVKVADGEKSLATTAGIRAALKADGALQIEMDPGVDPVTLCNLGAEMLPDGRQAITIKTNAAGSFYGAGERGHKLNLRGDTLVMYNRQNYGYTGSDPRISQMNITMPLLLSTDGFAILFDDYAAAELITTADGTIRYITENTNAVPWYAVASDDATLAGVTEQLTALTGRQPLPPLWALGYITSKYGYRTQQETLGVVDTLKSLGYPLDGIVLDLYWYGVEEDMGRLAWDSAQWPDPQGMMRQLADMDVNLVAISQPYVLRNGRGLSNYEQLSADGMLVKDSLGQGAQPVKIWVGEGGMLDVSNPATRQWLAERYGQLTDMGVGGWWGDLGEPEVHPEEGMHANGLRARQYHNQYGNDWSEIIYSLFREKYPDRRLLTMMRGGTTGLQRYSVFPWSTDVSRSWGGLQPQVTIMLQSGLSGLGYMGHDVGGFAVDPAHPYDPELYVRWMQLGLFSPMLRTHAQQYAEPYKYPMHADVLLDLARQRYAWLPYNYTLAYENAAFGYPMVRPLNFYELSGNDYDSITDEYLWGPEVLVAPVMQQGATERSITFPEGRWVEFAEPYSVYEGGTTLQSYPAPLENLPLFASAGAFIPMAPAGLNSTADYKPDSLLVRHYPVKGTGSSFTLYDDNRLSPTSLAYGQYRLITFNGATSDEGTIDISIESKGTYPGAPDRICLEFRICGVGAECRTLSVTDGKLKMLESADGQLRFSVEFNPDKRPDIHIVPNQWLNQ